MLKGWAEECPVVRGWSACSAGEGKGVSGGLSSSPRVLPLILIPILIEMHSFSLCSGANDPAWNVSPGLNPAWLLGAALVLSSMF